ncbi:MAG: hypothetical protein JWP01_624 [Myxococcales bacterium]|nr:hypothetical protein [Myxococcales bacterium]
MQSRDTELVEAFLVIDQPRQRLSHWTGALGPLDNPAAPPMATVAAYYDPDADQALLAVRYRAKVLGPAQLEFLVEIALLEEIGMIQPAELSEGDRKRFLNERLARCTLHIADQRGVTNTLTELVKRVRELKSQKQTVVGSVRPPPPPTPSARGLPRGDTQDPVMLVKAKGTRDDLPPAKLAKSTRDDLPPTRSEGSGGISKNVIPRKSVHRAPTVEMSPIEAYRKATESMPPPVPPPIPTTRRAHSPSEPSTERYMPPPSTPMPAGIIYARYLRSGRWVPLRIGALSLKGAALMSGALPRISDHVDVALSFGTHRALVRGSVGKVSSVDEVAMSGTATFSVAFQLDDAARRQLTDLLTAARAANVTIKPPPPRAARRYPVEWTVGIGTSRGVVRAVALDVSRAGLFVHPTHALTAGSTVTFSSVLDDGDAPVSGRAKVIRHVTEQEARSAGLSQGYGLSISDMGDADRERWLAFLERIERRSERRVLIGATPARLAELQAQLAALGYAVTGGTDPGALVQLASAEARPVDAALIDGAWLTPQMSSEWVQSLFSARNVPCVTLHGDAKRARLAIDKLLLP